MFTVNNHGKLRGAVSLVALVQADPAAPLRDITDHDPVRVHPDADLIDITLLMTDYNLLNLPVVDDTDHLIGVITVDDVLETSVPRNWRHREPTPQPDPTDNQDDDIDEHDRAAPRTHHGPIVSVSYTHLTLPTKRIV